MANTLINDKVLGQVIGAELPAKLKFSPVAVVDSTLTSVAGDTIKVEKYAYIGEAKDVAEGAEITISDLTMTEQDVTVKKACSGFSATDEQIVRRGAEVVNEGKKQLLMATQDHIDSDCRDTLATATLKYETTTKLDYISIVKANAKFGDKGHDFVKYLYISPDQEADLMLNDKFIDASQLADSVVTEGVIGKIAGCYVVVSGKITLNSKHKYTNFIVQQGGLGIKLAKEFEIEEDRKANTKSSAYYSSEFYVTYLRDASKVVAITCTDGTVQA
ncbi:N4-gp56 family major capsid protein [Clostridium butyricum]|uniref:N4-gp56 family major capsid protein n=1 Tax=Clostridium butyricum TaxID=1492 RepID=UPI003D3371DF